MVQHWVYNTEHTWDASRLRLGAISSWREGRQNLPRRSHWTLFGAISHELKPKAILQGILLLAPQKGSALNSIEYCFDVCFLVFPIPGSGLLTRKPSTPDLRLHHYAQ